MSEILIPGAIIDRTNFRGSGNHPAAGVKTLTWHCTTGPPGSIEGARTTLHQRSAESNILIEHRASEGRTEYQLVDLARAAKALKNTAKPGETNKGGTIQVEVVGPAEDPVIGTTPDDWRWLGSRARIWCDLVDVRCVAPFRFYPYLPTRWNPPQYLGKEFWRTLDAGDEVRGWVGHQHWTENLHGDPGDYSSPDPRLGGRSPLALMLEGAGVTPHNPQPQKGWLDMLSNEEQKELLAKVREIHAELTTSRDEHSPDGETVLHRLAQVDQRTSDLVTGKRPAKA